MRVIIEIQKMIVHTPTTDAMEQQKSTKTGIASLTVNA